MSDRRLKIKLQPAVLRWARERAGFAPDELAEKLNVKPERVREWESSGEISIAQIGKLAQRTHTPEGWLFLDEPPDDRLPIADFRTVGGDPRRRPSPNLLETVYAMQRRQSWMRDELLIDEADPLEFVGQFDENADIQEVASGIRDALRLENGWASRNPNWSAALRHLRNRVEDAGVLVFINGIVGNNTHRPLDPGEFRGFALIDEYAPLIFINNADFVSAQMFTIAHELAHIFVGHEGVSNFESLLPSDHSAERFCDSIAAEFLIPREDLAEMWATIGNDKKPYQQIAREFKVSVIVAARRVLDLDLIDRATYLDFYAEYLDDERRRKVNAPGGGNFWNNQNFRLGRRFQQCNSPCGQGRTLAVPRGILAYRAEWQNL